MLRLVGSRHRLGCLTKSKHGWRTLSTDTSTILPSAMLQMWQAVSASTPVAYLQETLIQLHDITHLPWCGTIVLSTLCLRTLITLPLTIYQQQISARLELLSVEMRQLQEELKQEVARAKHKYKWTQEQAKRMYIQSAQKHWNKLIVRDNCHPLKLFIVLFGQIPLWVCQSFALRNLVQMMPDPLSIEAQIAFQELSVGGFAWIPNLTEVDSSYILPFALGIINFINIEVQTALRSHLPQNRLQKYAHGGFHLLNIVMVPVACTVPSALCLYWTTSSAYGLGQNILLVSPRVRRAIGIKHTNKELDHPYRLLAQTLQSRLKLTTTKKSENT